MYNTLDITGFKQKGIELQEAILNEIKPLATSKLLVTLPDSIRMTQEQYDDLMLLGNMENMYHSEDRMYITPYNVMEVRVNQRKRLTFKEVNQLDDKAFDEWEKTIGETNA